MIAINVCVLVHMPIREKSNIRTAQA